MDGWDSIPGRGEIFFLLHGVQAGSAAHPASYIYRGSFPEG
jgi:hypothetical protein